MIEFHLIIIYINSTIVCKIIVIEGGGGGLGAVPRNFFLNFSYKMVPF